MGYNPISMKSRVNQPRPPRSYHAPRRTAAAAETRQAILRAAKEEFEVRGWAATTMRSIAMSAGVSPKTVEALFATKPALLEATLLAALGGDAANGDLAVLRPEAVLEHQREAAREMEAAPDAATMLKLHSAVVSEVNARVAWIYWAVETAVPSDAGLAEIWARLAEAQLFALRWSAETLLRKPGARTDLTRREVEVTFLTVTDWNTYRTLTTKGNMSPEEVQAWVARYYHRMLLA
ncbi:MAG: TetR family transcriptional regulator [Solirubrobacterales bacterium]|nr:TetR family transcriptional regulator [Solirubrobacterales bacterium]